jgi:hypothetical protein
MDESEEEMRSSPKNDLYVGLDGLRRVGLLVFLAASAALFVGALLASLLE